MRFSKTLEAVALLSLVSNAQAEDKRPKYNSFFSI